MGCERTKTGNMASLAVCAVAVALGGGSGAATSAVESRAVDQVQRYCATSWRNAGIARQDWSDCTQEAIARLLARISRDRLPTALADRESDERRELNRCVWSTVQQWRRKPRPHALEAGSWPDHRFDPGSSEDVDQVASVLASLSSHEQRILRLWADGWTVAEIAAELDLPAARVSDQKYKAIRKVKRMIAQPDCPQAEAALLS